MSTPTPADLPSPTLVAIAAAVLAMPADGDGWHSVRDEAVAAQIRRTVRTVEASFLELERTGAIDRSRRTYGEGTRYIRPLPHIVWSLAAAALAQGA